MVGNLRHRGPDNQETLQDGRVALGHARLSILDLSPAARQPMRSADGRFLLAYNGEIYNYAPLREQLERQGHIFRTNSDTECSWSFSPPWARPACRCSTACLLLPSGTDATSA